jgi:hypothetical protein
MSWYKQAKQASINKNLTKEFLSDLKKFSELDWKGQEGDWITFGDVNRYTMDAYSIKLYLSKTERGWTISLMTNHAYLGTAQYCVFWRFDLEQKKEAYSVYNKVNDIVRKTVKEFISEEKPTSLFDPVLRSRIQKLHDKDIIRTNIPVINYSYDIDYEADWDRNIYGPRYPKYHEESFSQYLNNSIYNKTNTPTGKFAL